ncbi:MAG: polyprenyl synthetase family protein [Anaerolineaceae bacterium]
MTNDMGSQVLVELKSGVNSEIQRILAIKLLPDYRVLHEMMTYQMGWDVESGIDAGGGKRLRPIFLLLSCQAAGGNWKEALPAAAAVELLHNFTLIHDDIQDQSPTRHGRPSVWKKWNMPLAINAGDTMFSLAILALLELKTSKNAEIIFQAQQVLLNTCVQLTYGQHLDISNESKDEISIAEYLTMIEGKTAALIGTSMKIGVISAGGEVQTQDLADQLGRSVGMAFQVIDDILGIWGETQRTGKSIESDLMSRKLSLPILYGIQQKKTFARRWRKGRFDMQEIPEIAMILEEEGARKFAESMAKEYTAKAIEILNTIGFKNEAAIELKNLCEKLISRDY